MKMIKYNILFAIYILFAVFDLVTLLKAAIFAAAEKTCLKVIFNLEK